MIEKKNNPIDPNLEKISVPQRKGDNITIKDLNTPAGNKLTDKKQEKYSITKPQVQGTN
ncbi:MAG: hypothetical protein QY322_00280 [bacterium]|nr:MAG: hypothetical protein QY322_00280 [bacterium]